jgi:hypothetical protein
MSNWIAGAGRTGTVITWGAGIDRTGTDDNL